MFAWVPEAGFGYEFFKSKYHSLRCTWLSPPVSSSTVGLWRRL